MCVFFFNFSVLKLEIQLIYNVVLVSEVHQSDCHTSTYVLLQLLLHYRLLQDTEHSSLVLQVGPCLLALYLVVSVC